MAASSDRVAVLGATGQLGSDLVRAAGRRRVPCAALVHAQADVTKPDELRAALRASGARAVVNCAAFHHVDKCEDDPETALRVNGLGALNVARATAALGLGLIHISTDYVFSGAKDPPVAGNADAAHAWIEKDPTGPVNVYGASKLVGEHLVLQANPDALVARVSSLFGIAGASGKGGNFVETMLRKAKEGAPLKVVDDQWMTPTYTRDAADALLDLAAKGIPRGILHVTAPNATTWHRFAAAVFRTSGVRAELSPIPTKDFPGKAARPQNGALCTDALASRLGRRLPPWEEALRDYLIEKGHLPATRPRTAPST